MYERVASNVRKTWMLIFVFIVLVTGVGWAFGYWTGIGHAGLVIAVVVALAMTWGSYFNSDKLALAVSRAKPADPAAHAQLINIVEALSIAAGMKQPRVFVVDDEAPNAFATGRNEEHAAVAVTTGLMEKLNRDELEGVIAHELSHIKNRDILVMTLAVTLVGVVVLLADWMLRAMFWGGGRKGRNNGGGAGAILAIVGLVLLILAPLFAQMLHFAISRQREFLADADAVFITRYPDGLISALEKLKADETVVATGSRATAHMWIESPVATQKMKGKGMKNTTRSGAWLNRIFETHPPLEMRIEALRTSALSGAVPPVTPAG